MHLIGADVKRRGMDTGNECREKSGMYSSGMLAIFEWDGTKVESEYRIDLID